MCEGEGRKGVREQLSECVREGGRKGGVRVGK